MAFYPTPSPTDNNYRLQTAQQNYGTTAGQSPQQYSYSPNGQGGVNYFYGTNPITNTEYGKATGVNYGALEQQVAQSYGGQGSGSSNVLANLPTSIPNTSQQAGAGAPAFQPTYGPDGVLYTDPNQLAMAQQHYYQQNYDTQYGLLQDAYSSGQQGLQGRQLGINQNKQQLLQQYDPNSGDGQVINSYNNNLASLLQAKNQALGSQSAYSSYVSPNATQSAFKDLAQNTTDEFGRQQGTLDTNKANNIQQVQNALGTVDQNQAQLGTDTTQFDDQYAANKAGLENSLLQQNTSANQGVQDFKNKSAAYSSAYKAATANTQNLDPVALLGQLQQYQINAKQFGYNDEQTRGLISTQLANLGVSQKQIPDILKALYGIPGNSGGTNQ